MALLGEMYYKPDGMGSWYNLPRESGIAYAAQESWVLNETIRVRHILYPCQLGLMISVSQDNILLGQPYNEQRYKKGRINFRLAL